MPFYTPDHFRTGPRRRAKAQGSDRALPFPTALHYLFRMFDAWKSAWREAVDNFRKELDPGEGDALDRAVAMRRDLTTAEREFARLETELVRARREHAEEEEAARRCQRQEAMAREIDDVETAELAATFAARHAERARVFLGKLQALEAEAELRRKELDEMRERWAHVAREAAAPTPDEDPLADPLGPTFERLEQNAKEEAAERRLDELKRRMG